MGLNLRLLGLTLFALLLVFAVLVVLAQPSGVHPVYSSPLDGLP